LEAIHELHSRHSRNMIVGLNRGDEQLRSLQQENQRLKLEVSVLHEQSMQRNFCSSTSSDVEELDRVESVIGGLRNGATDGDSDATKSDKSFTDEALGFERKAKPSCVSFCHTVDSYKSITPNLTQNSTDADVHRASSATTGYKSRSDTIRSSFSMFDNILWVTKMPALRTQTSHDRKNMISQEYKNVLESVGAQDRFFWAMRQSLRTHSGPLTCRSRCARNIVLSSVFKAIVLVLIVANALHVGIATHVTMHVTLQELDKAAIVGDVSDRMPAWVALAESLFALLFCVELLLRILGFGKEFFIGPDACWNIFDSALVISSIVDIILTTIFIDISFIRVFRVLRLVRTMRMIRLIRAAAFFRTLRLMLLAIVTSSMPLIWAFIVLTGMIYVFGVVFQQGAADYISTATMDDVIVDRLRTWFSSMPQTLLTLFMSREGSVGGRSSILCLKFTWCTASFLFFLYV